DELHRDEVDPLIDVDVVDGDDVRMVQRRCGFRFLNEPPPPVGVDGLVSRKDLERGEAFEAGVARLVHDTHAAFPELFEDLVMTKTAAGTDHCRPMLATIHGWET